LRRVCLVVGRYPEMMDATLNAEKVFPVVVNPELQHFRNLSAKVTVKYFLDREVENRSLQFERVTRDPVDRVGLRLSPRNQLQSNWLCWQRPNGKSRSCVIDEDPSLGLLHNAEKDRQRMLDDPPYRLGTSEHPRRHRALHLHRVIRSRPSPLSI